MTDALTFTLSKAAIKPSTRLDCSKLVPHILTGLSIDNILALRVSMSACVGDFFEVSGSDATHIVFKNSNAQLDHIGHQMKSGQITIEGDCGDFLASAMQNGIIVCKGNAGERVADKMRRGIVLIDGNVGAYCASSMIAGTIGITGNTGAHLGYGLRRGTILMLQAPKLSATWQDCGQINLPFLKLLFNAFRPLDSAFAKLSNTRVQRWMGDASQNGKGEILWCQN